MPWGQLAAADPALGWALLTDARSLGQLQRGDGAPGLRTAIAPRDWSFDTLATEIEGLLRRAGGGLDTLRIVTGVERTQLVAASLRAHFGAPGPGPDDVEPFVNKLVMKRSMRGVDELLPAYVEFDPAAFRRDPERWLDEAVGRVGLPAFAKPLADFSSRGTALCRTRGELRAFCEQTTSPYEIDAFVEGVPFHCDALVQGGEVRWFGACRLLNPCAETLHGAPFADATLPEDSDIFRALEAVNRRLLASFPRVPDGATHLEAFLTGEGFRFIEVAARPAGARVPDIYAIRTGVDLRTGHYRLQAGLPLELSPRPGPHAAYYAPLKVHAGRIARLNPPPFVSPHRVEWYPEAAARTEAVSANSLADLLGVSLLWNDDADALAADLERLQGGYRPYELA